MTRPAPSSLAEARQRLGAASGLKVQGKVTDIVGLVATGACPQAAVGSLCALSPLDGGPSVAAEVVGFRGGQALLMALGSLRGLGPGSLIEVRRAQATVRCGDGLLGRVLDPLGMPLDGLGTPERLDDERPIYGSPPHPLARRAITTPLDLGVKAINTLLTCGEGQRLGIMAGSGVGKSVLLGTMAQHAVADVNVIALIGERGREVGEFIERDLGPEGLARSVVVCATSDQPPLLRMRGAFLATAIAEHFCARGARVLLMMDSVTRLAMAMREIGLAVGEPPATRGYTPSVFAALPQLLERAGAFRGQGSITGLYTVLVEGDDMNDIIGDTVRSILDGHIVLSRELAARNHYPAIDVLHSVSRLMSAIAEPEHQRLAGRLRELLATYEKNADMIHIGEYRRGSNARIDEAIAFHDAIETFLKQPQGSHFTLEQSLAALRSSLGESA